MKSLRRKALRETHAKSKDRDRRRNELLYLAGQSLWLAREFVAIAKLFMRNAR
jgi:hypothetical protein